MPRNRPTVAVGALPHERHLIPEQSATQASGGIGHARQPFLRHVCKLGTIRAHAMLEKPDNKASVQPLFRILGYCRPNCGLPWYYVEIKGEIRAYRAWEAANSLMYLDLVPDQEHWRSLFPHSVSKRRFDVTKAREWFFRQCEAAGEYDPPAWMRPKGSGRPMGAKDSYQRVRSR